MKNKGFIIFLIILVLVIGGGIAFSIVNRETDNPKGTIGNTSGNLLNGGLFCEDDGVVYFSNPYDDFKIYSMKPDQTDVKKISEVPAKFINSGGKFLYFYQTSSITGNESRILGMNGIYGICRIGKRGGGAAESIDRSVCSSLILVDDDVYYQHYSSGEGLTLYKADKKGKEKGKISDDDISPCCVRDGLFFFANKSTDFYLSTYDPVRGTVSRYAQIRAYNVIADGMYLYYMNVDDDYSIYRYNIADKSSEKLTNDRADLFNVYGDYIFYQKSSETAPCLMRMRSDGSNPEVVADGNYTDINCTSAYTYFTAFDEESPIYQTLTGGPINVGRFEPVSSK